MKLSIVEGPRVFAECILIREGPRSFGRARVSSDAGFPQLDSLEVIRGHSHASRPLVVQDKERPGDKTAAAEKSVERDKTLQRMDLTATVCATSAAAAACKPLKHLLLTVSAASSSGRSLARPLAALAAAVKAVETSTDAAAAAASAAAASFAAELADDAMHSSEVVATRNGFDEYKVTENDTARQHAVDVNRAFVAGCEQFGRSELRVPSEYPEIQSDEKLQGRPQGQYAGSEFREYQLADVPSTDNQCTEYKQSWQEERNQAQAAPASTAEPVYENGKKQNILHEQRGAVKEGSVRLNTVQLEQTVGPSPKRATLFHSPLARSETQSVADGKIDSQFEIEHRVSSRTKSKMSSLLRRGLHRQRLFERDQSHARPQNTLWRTHDGLLTCRRLEERQDHGARNFSVDNPPALSDPGHGLANNIGDVDDSDARSGHRSDAGGDDDGDETVFESEEQERCRQKETNAAQEGKKRPADVALAQEGEVDAREIKDSAKVEEGDAKQTPYRPRAAKLVAQRLVCAPRKRRRSDSDGATILAADNKHKDNDKDDEKDDADFVSNDDSETDDDDDDIDIDEDDDDDDDDVNTGEGRRVPLSSGLGKANSRDDAAIKQHPLVLKHGSTETAMSVVPKDISQMSLVSGMVIRASILFDVMQRHANENRNEMLEAVLALQTSQYWSLRCHRHGRAPRAGAGARSKSKKCNCRWRVCFRVVNEADVLAAKDRASRGRDGAQREAQIAAALLMINSVHDEHTGHKPEPFLRGLPYLGKSSSTRR
jgi:hypothetical protein